MTMVAMCPNCNTPLVMTFKYRYKEFICLECRGLFEFLQPIAAEETPALLDKMAQYQADWIAEQQLIDTCKALSTPSGLCRDQVHVLPCGPTHDQAECACGCTGYDEYCVAELISGLVGLLA